MRVTTPAANMAVLAAWESAVACVPQPAHVTCCLGLAPWLHWGAGGQGQDGGLYCLHPQLELRVCFSLKWTHSSHLLASWSRPVKQMEYKDGLICDHFLLPIMAACLRKAVLYRTHATPVKSWDTRAMVISLGKHVRSWLPKMLQKVA